MTTTHVPGEVHFLPPEELSGGDPKTRRHVVVSACDPHDVSVTLALGSTRATEAQWGAAHVVVDPFATTYHGTGFDRSTYVYPARLHTTDMTALGRPVGQLVYEMPDLLRSVRRALGIGTGTTERGTAAGSLRGRVAQFTREVVEATGATYALIVTEPHYATHRRNQTVIPILDGTCYDATTNDVVVAAADWLRAVALDRAVLAVPDVLSVWHPTRLVDVSRSCVDDATMTAVDQALTQHFGL